MLKSAMVAFFGLASLLTVGCQSGDDEPATVSGRVAIVDLDAVAKKLGRDVQMTDSFKEQQETLVAKLKDVQASFTKQINDKKDEFVKAAGFSEPAGNGATDGQKGAFDGEANPFDGQPGGADPPAPAVFPEPKQEPAKAADQLTDEQKRQLIGLVRDANAKLGKARQDAGTMLSQHRAKLITDFRDEVKPIATQIAHEKGLTIVVTKNDSVLLTYDGAVDITNAVVKRLKSGGAKSSD